MCWRPSCDVYWRCDVSAKRTDHVRSTPVYQTSNLPEEKSTTDCLEKKGKHIKALNCNNVRIFNNAVLTEDVTCRRIRREDGHGWLVVRKWTAGTPCVFLSVGAYRHNNNISNNNNNNNIY